MKRAGLSFAVGTAEAALLLLASPAVSADEPAAAPIARLAMGPAFHIAPKAEKGTEVAFDATAGINVAVAGWKAAGLIVSAEVGYAYDGATEHAFQVVPGIGYGHPLAFVSYHPHLLIVSAYDQTSFGLRNGLTMHLLVDMLSLEIAEQFVSAAGAHHDVRVMFGVNPAAFVYAISKL